MADKAAIIENFGYRLQTYHPKAIVQVGVGNPNANVVVVQPHSKMPERDAITGALKNFGMLSDSYRATSLILSDSDEEINRYYLRELLEIIRPLIVVACGPDIIGLLRQKKVRSFQSHTGKKFKVKDLPTFTFYATIDPTSYGYARAPQSLKQQGKAEWTTLSKIYKVLKEKQKNERWTC